MSINTQPKKDDTNDYRKALGWTLVLLALTAFWGAVGYLAWMTYKAITR